MPPKTYSDAHIAAVHVHWEQHIYDGIRALPFTSRWVFLLRRIRGRFLDCFGRLFDVIVVLAICFLGKKEVRFLAALAVWVTFGIALEFWATMHYQAPVIVILFALLATCLTRLEAATLHSRFGRTIPLAALAVLFLGMVFVTVSHVREMNRERNGSWFERRHEIAQSLAGSQGKHLVFVRYAPDHPDDIEWVYNCANIDGSDVVWARWLDDTQNSRVLAYFAGRRFWVLDADKPHWPLAPLSEK